MSHKKTKLLIGLLAALTHASTSYADLSETLAFDIPPQALQEALIKYSAQSRVQVTGAADIINGKASAGVSGTFPARLALTRLLQGTDLTYEVINENTVIIRRAPIPTTAPVAEPVQATRAESAATHSAETPDSASSNSGAVQEIVVTGSRFSGRLPLNSPVPVDVVSAEVLRGGGRTELAESVAAVVPSLSFQVAAPASAASALRPITLRGLPANEVLILVNGKRWHQSAVYGTGVLAFDFNSFPPTSVESIEVLRDGAAAQYGSDAIAGVVNLRLRRDTQTELVATGGQYFAGDGLTLEAGVDTGLRIGSEGFAHLSAYYRDADNTNRQGRDVRQQYFAFDPNGNPVVLGVVGPNNSTPILPAGYSFDLREFTGVDRLNNYNLGNAERREAGLNFNSEIPVHDSVTAYGFGGYAHRTAETVFLWRQPLSNNTVRAIFPNGYAPVYEARIADAQLTAGVKGEAGGWAWDLSESWGFNRLASYADHTVNPSFGAASPTSFFSGAQKSGQATTNLDVKRDFDIGLRSPLRVALGSEYRHERLEIRPGEPASYQNGGVPILDGPSAGAPAPIGASGVGGYTPTDAVDATRSNIAAYVDLENQLTDSFLLTLAGRYEHYSDFGSTTNGKLSFRQAFNPVFAIRGSLSTGFRAPSLYETYFSNTGSAVIGGQFLVNRNFPVGDPVARALGAVPLEPEESVNYSLGAVLTFDDRLSFTVDAYRIDIDDVIIQSSFFGGPGVTAFLAARGFTGVNLAQFFTNAVDKRVEGLDVTANFTTRFDDGSRLTLSSGMNFNDPQVTSVDPTPPELAAVTPTTLFNQMAIVTAEQGMPRTRINTAAVYRRGGLDVVLRLTRYGSTRAFGNNPPFTDQTYDARWVTDLDVSYDVSDSLRLTAGGQNLFDVYPEENNSFNNPAGLFTNSFGFNAPFGLSGGYYYVRALMRF